jgi:hypothetical protein
MIDEIKIKTALKEFKNKEPFDHCVIDGFFEDTIADKLEAEFPPYDDPRWFHYHNPLEDKKALNVWSEFPTNTLETFRALNSEKMTKLLTTAIGAQIYADPDLHGGGWHIHKRGGKLNPHLDYEIHPKLRLLRKINIIIYLSSKLEAAHGGGLGLWDHSEKTNQPGSLRRSIQPKFNRAVIFDTTQKSWHGICSPLTPPEGIYRKSLAVYYLMAPGNYTGERERALYAPTDNQKNDKLVLDLIKRRAHPTDFSSAYKTD